ncbi:hypothetical protein DAPPUDRAFT_330891 [Daphnia pulex]|uniref:DUF659 domain-containing protein n=1 Tax=Daphnia pulex TaxID=6669 RepID=E9HKY1_DAPPU|nr:hypothetical protein DAPPUDRAFT_330891 [Daphnia pulex]|eukprot:EFX67600.1 hypothetical protein DAPPUDRAFT_330891 [Daphnia pulex]
MILETLVEYEISLSQVYTITTENGSNMLLAVKLLSEERRSSTNNDDYVEDEEDGILDLLESQCFNEVGKVIIGIRCATHTLQLAVEDALKNNC